MAAMWGDSVAKSAESLRKGSWCRKHPFGIFVHWGLYSIPGNVWKGKVYHGNPEWLMCRAGISIDEYAQLADSFNPEDFDAEKLVDLVRASGAGHLMVSAKHHEGFAMFKSNASPFNIVDAAPFGRDPLDELAEACRAAGIKMGIYYSQTLDWHEPDGVNLSDLTGNPDFQRYFESKALPQIEELCSNYGPLAGIWFDTPGPITREQSEKLVRMVNRLQPDCLVNSRIGNGLGDYDSMGDMEIPLRPRDGLWETPDTTNDGWGYAVHDRNWKSPDEIVRRFVRVVSRGGMYLLNIGPDGTGRIPAEADKLLRRVGRWIREHGTAVMDVEPSPFGPLPWGECTRRGNRLFFHLFDWPEQGRLVVPGLSSAIEHAEWVNTGEAVLFEERDGFVVFDLPPIRPDRLVPVLAVTCRDSLHIEDSLCVLDGHVNVLSAPQATLEECALRQERWMEYFGEFQAVDVITDWHRNGRAAWYFKTVYPGLFYLEIQYGCPALCDGASWTINVDGDLIYFSAVDSGWRDRRVCFGPPFDAPLPRFITRRLGLFRLSTPGNHVISVSPADSAGAAVRIASVRLIPVDE